MSQYNTNMSDAGYLAFCSAWSCCFSLYALSVLDGKLYEQADRAGIVFG